MKALIYKEFKLAMHPICYLFIFIFPIMILIPNYPIAVGFIYILCCYPILFLGANKGQQSNDLLYSTLLPVRKKDIVFARILTVIFMQITFILIMSCLVPLAYKTHSVAVNPENNTAINPGFSLDAYVSTTAIAIIGLSIADLVYFPIYYKNGKSIVMSTLLTIISFVIYLGIFTIFLPLKVDSYKHFFENSNLLIQFIILAASIIISAGIHFLVYKISSRELEKVDF